MRKQNILLLLLIVISSQANSEKLIFSKNGAEIDITGDVVIDNQYGNVTVTTDGQENYIIINENQPVILGFYPDKYTAETGAGNGIGVSWVVANADTCTASTDLNRSSWAGNKTATDGLNPQIPEQVTFTEFPATLRLVCSNSITNNSTSRTFEVTKAVPLNPEVNYFRVNNLDGPTVNVSGVDALVNISWLTTDVNNCDATSSPSLSEWNSSDIGESGNVTSIEVNETTIVSLTCDNLATESITINHSINENPTINFFRVNGTDGGANSTVNVTGPDATAIINWSTTDVNNCIATSSPTLAGWDSTSIGTSGPTASLDINQTTVVSLECDSLTKLDITINYLPGDNQACAGITPPNGLSQAPKKITYTELNQGFPFGATVNSTSLMTFNKNQYAEISGFIATEANLYRKLKFAPAPSSTRSSGHFSVSISECPGDFTENAACVRDLQTLSYPELKITTNLNEPDSRFCKLVKDKVYYLNMIHDPTPFDQTPGSCLFTTDTTCTVFFTESVDQP